MRIDCAFQVYGAVAAGRNLNDIQGDLRTQRRCFIICNIFIYLFNIIFIFKMQAFSHARQPLINVLRPFKYCSRAIYYEAARKGGAASAAGVHEVK